MLCAPGAGGSSRSRQGSDIEPEEADVAVLHHVVLALQPYLATFAGDSVGAGGLEVGEGHDLGLDESPLEVGVDDTRGLRGGGAAPHRPGPHLGLTGGEEGEQVEEA